MENLQEYRSKQLSKLTDEIGVYALCDLDNVPIYIGKSTDGIRTRVRRHLTSARSDVIANRQVDVWEIAFVRAWPMKGRSSEITQLETKLILQYHSINSLMNGKIPAQQKIKVVVPEFQFVQILPNKEIENRKDPIVRLPRQSLHFYNMFSHVLEVKNNDELRRTLHSHFQRLQNYYSEFRNSYSEDIES